MALEQEVAARLDAQLDRRSEIHERIATIDEERTQLLKEVEDSTPVIEFLEKWIQELKQARSGRKKDPSEPTTPKGPSIRSVVSSALRELKHFTKQELVSKVKDTLTEAKVGSIEAEMSYAKGRGEIEKLDDDTYISNIYEDNDPSEPGSNFGSLHSLARSVEEDDEARNGVLAGS